MADTLTAPCEGALDDVPTYCGEASSATVVIACAHEHVDRMRTCYAHAAEAQMEGAPWTCPRCRDGETPYECDAWPVIEWDSGEKTIIREACSG